MLVVKERVVFISKNVFWTLYIKEMACGLQEVLQLLLNSKFRVKTREVLGKTELWKDIAKPDSNDHL